MTKPFDNGIDLDLELETAPKNITIHVHGQRFGICMVDRKHPHYEGKFSLSRSMSLFEGELEREPGDGSELTLNPHCGAVVISRAFRVLQVLEPLDERITVVLSPDVLVLTVDYRLFKEKLSDLFHVGDTVKFRNHGEVIVFEELRGVMSNEPYLKLNHSPLFLAAKPTASITGRIAQHHQLQHLRVNLNGIEVAVTGSYDFSCECKLNQGINRFIVQLIAGETICYSREITVYYITNAVEQQKVFLWVEQGHNLVNLSLPGAVRSMLQQAKKIGVTAIVVDVKGIEGFAGYKQNTLTGRPYASTMQAPGRSGANPDIDLLLEFTTIGNEIGIEIYAAFNVFAEGSYYRNEYGLPQLLDSGGQYVLHPSDNGSIMRHQESEQVRSGEAKIAYVNPANDEIRAAQLSNIAEVIAHYDIAGVVLDRCRYDDEYADFSDVSRAKFAEFVQKKGSSLENWPADVYTYKDGVRKEGPLWKQWWEFRANVITSFVQEVRTLIDTYHATNWHKQRMELAVYVGAWYEYAYRHGINWASKAFQYYQNFDWPEQEIYTSDYTNTGYVDCLDFIMIGAYQQTLREVEHYITMAHLVTNGEIPIITGIALPYVQESEAFPTILQAALSQSAGVMLFDHCHIKWQAVEQALIFQAKREE